MSEMKVLLQEKALFSWQKFLPHFTIPHFWKASEHECANSRGQGREEAQKDVPGSYRT